MRQQRRLRGVSRELALLLGVVAFASALQPDSQVGGSDIDPFKLAGAFEGVPDENVTKLLDEIVAPASLESEKAVPPPVSEGSRDLRPFTVSKTEQHTRSLTTAVPYGGALVAVEATALLVGGATIAVLLIAKVKGRYSAAQYEYGEATDSADPMLQSLLYSDMDYAAI
ncbi:hypothetical protein PRIC1_007528 [Phytophthora ramorum]|uniref:uncharacterized protein n=1 Tax=Phytophthora ramorum TaxID=164328 RepID=UPI00309EBEF3|nr:hypothetical protein KRP23_2306 [Phytophthora ramorum]KAH7502370.1 hypothetical protein KRP22_7838 [Phytophthora ramorum]